MHLEAAYFDNSLHKLTDVFTKWYEDLERLENLIKAKKEKGEATATLEVNLSIGIRRYKAMDDFTDSAIAFVQALQLQIASDRRDAQELKILKKQISQMERRWRVHFTDML